MSKDSAKKHPLMLILSAATAIGAASAAPVPQLTTDEPAPPPITVTVNGIPVTFIGTEPTEIKGAVLVPLRGVFEAMQATVTYDPSNHTIYAEKGSATVTLLLGGSKGTVNGQSEPLVQPAQTVNGTTLVPLRFVAQALGAYVQWNAANSIVQIQTSEPHLSSLPTPGGTGPVVGQVTGIYARSVPQSITVRVNGQDNAVTLSPQTIVMRAQIGQPMMEVPLSQLNVGDEVRIIRNETGAAIRITSTFGELSGTVKTITRLPNGDPYITLNNGISVELIASPPVTMGGRKIGITDIYSNEKITIRTNNNNTIGYGIAVATGGNQYPVPPGTVPESPAAPAPDAAVTP